MNGREQKEWSETIKEYNELIQIMGFRKDESVILIRDLVNSCTQIPNSGAQEDQLLMG